MVVRRFAEDKNKKTKQVTYECIFHHHRSSFTLATTHMLLYALI